VSPLALDTAGGKSWVGLGENPKHANDRNRSRTLEEFAPLTAVGGVIFALQKGNEGEQLAPAGMELTHLGPQLKGFYGTALVLGVLIP
jgi:hypothetical protein